MRFTIISIFVCFTSVVLGIGSAWVALERESIIETISVGQWNAIPNAADRSADLYTKAYFARNGSSWMSLAEGLALFSTHDSFGDPYSGSCVYRLRGKIPRGRLWTLSYVHGMSLDGMPSPYFMTSEDVVWREDGTIEIMISRDVEPGNWLPLLAQDRLILVLRVYDTPLTSAEIALRLDTPHVEKLKCP